MSEEKCADSDQLRCDDGRAVLTTAVVWSNARLNRRLLIIEHMFYMIPEYLTSGCLGGSECSNRISGANFDIVLSRYDHGTMET